jgi:ribosomal protein S9
MWMHTEVQFEYHQTGGGIVGNADAITYELVKNAIAYYYDNMINSTRRVEITKFFLSVYLD